MEILKSHFSEAEIQEIQELPDFAEIREQIIEKQVNRMLDNLDEVAKKNFQERLKAAKDVRDKLRIFMNPENKPESEAPEGTGFDFSILSLDDLRKKAEEGFDGAKEYLEKQTDSIIASGENKFKESWLGKLLPEKFVNAIMSGAKDYASGKIDGLKGSLFAMLIGFIPGGKFLLSAYKKVYGNNDRVADETQSGGTQESPQTANEEGERSGSEGPIPEVIEERFNITKKGVYESTGFDIMAVQSGIETTKNPNTSAIYKVLANGGYSVSNLQEVFFTTNKENTGEVLKKFGFGDEYSEAEVVATIKGIIGPFNTSFLQSTFNQRQDIQDILFGEDSNIKDNVVKVLNNDEVKKIQEVNYDYTKIPLSILARIISLYWENISLTSYVNINKTSRNIGNNVHNFLFGPNITNVIANLGDTNTGSNVLPENVVLLFKDIEKGDANLKKSREVLVAEFGGGLEYNDKENEAIDAFIGFRDEVRDFIPTNTKYSLGMDNFSEKFLSKLNYQNLTILFILTQGKPLSRLDATDSLIVYAWIHQIMGSDQGSYEAAIIDSLKDDSGHLTEDEKNILMVIFFRLLENNRDRVTSYIANKYDFFHDSAKNLLPENIVDDGTRNILAWGIEIGGAAGLWRLLKFAPYVRGALVVTTGLTLGAVLIFSQELMYRSLKSNMQEKFDSFLMDNLNGNSGQAIRQKINNGEIGPDQLLLSLTDTDFTGLFS